MVWLKIKDDCREQIFDVFEICVVCYGLEGVILVKMVDEVGFV